MDFLKQHSEPERIQTEPSKLDFAHFMHNCLLNNDSIRKDFEEEKLCLQSPEERKDE